MINNYRNCVEQVMCRKNHADRLAKVAVVISYGKSLMTLHIKSNDFSS